jgi:hypothetical protein
MYTDPAKNLRLARRLAALSLGIDEADLPPDADISISHDANGELRVVGSIVAKGHVPSIECKVLVTSERSPQ